MLEKVFSRFWTDLIIVRGKRLPIATPTIEQKIPTPKMEKIILIMKDNDGNLSTDIIRDYPSDIILEAQYEHDRRRMIDNYKDVGDPTTLQQYFDIPGAGNSPRLV